MTGRIRSLKPEWLEDDPLVSCSDSARVLSAALILLADDHGRGRGSEKFLGSRVFPGESLAKVREALAELSTIRYVGLYEVEGQKYYEIRNWSKHQKVDKPGKPRVPAPLEKIRYTLAKVPESLATDLEHRSIGSRIETTTRTNDQDQRPTRAKPKSADPGTDAVVASPSAPPSGACPFPELSPEHQAAAVGSNVSGRIFELWRYSYAGKMHGDPPPWSKGHFAAAAKLAAAKGESTVLRGIPAFFAWRNSKPISAGYPFMGGYASFCAMFDELWADATNSHRRADAAKADATMRQHAVAAQADGLADEAIRIMRAREAQP